MTVTSTLKNRKVELLNGVIFIQQRIDQRDDSVCNRACQSTQQPEFKPWDPNGRKRRAAMKRCPLDRTKSMPPVWSVLRTLSAVGRRPISPLFCFLVTMRQEASVTCPCHPDICLTSSSRFSQPWIQTPETTGHNTFPFFILNKKSVLCFRGNSYAIVAKTLRIKQTVQNCQHKCRSPAQKSHLFWTTLLLPTQG